MADDQNKKAQKRIRQNVIFELGMALIEIGREKCILLSDFDVHDKTIDLPTDMNSLEILQFNAVDLEKILDDVINKILQFRKDFSFSDAKTEKIPQYDWLLTRDNYFVDYENIFLDVETGIAKEGKKFFTETLKMWSEELEGLRYFDERCIYLLERIGLIPVFGK